MNLEITNKNLYLLLPGKVSRVAQMYADDQKIPLTEALYRFYSSDTYKKLADETTLLSFGTLVLWLSTKNFQMN